MRALVWTHNTGIHAQSPVNVRSQQRDLVFNQTQNNFSALLLASQQRRKLEEAHWNSHIQHEIIGMQTRFSFPSLSYTYHLSCLPPPSPIKWPWRSHWCTTLLGFVTNCLTYMHNPTCACTWLSTNTQTHSWGWFSWQRSAELIPV